MGKRSAWFWKQHKFKIKISVTDVLTCNRGLNAVHKDTFSASDGTKQSFFAHFAFSQGPIWAEDGNFIPLWLN
jgi:hypothetical protein